MEKRGTGRSLSSEQSSSWGQCSLLRRLPVSWRLKRELPIRGFLYCVTAVLIVAIALSYLLLFDYSQNDLTSETLVGVVTLGLLTIWLANKCRLEWRAYITERRNRAQEALLEVRTQIALIEELVTQGRERYLECQQHDVAELNVLKPGGMRALAGVQRMIDALEDRGAKLRDLTRAADEEKLIAAAKICSSPLCFDNTSFDTMSGGDLPEITSEKWQATLDNLFSRLGL